MKQIFALIAACVMSGATSFAASRYWIGSSNGTWNNVNNWSAEADGAAGASVPGVNDDVFFTKDAIVEIDNTPSIHSLEVAISRNVIFYTSHATSITISGNLRLSPGSTLKDSTSAPVAFPVIFNAATAATADIYGYWIFASNSQSSEGPNFVAPAGTKVNVFGQVFSSGEGRIVNRQNAGTIQSTTGSLEFKAGSYFVNDSDVDGSIPAATWNVSSTLSISGDLKTLVHQAIAPSYGVVSIDLPTLASDASFALPNGAEVKNLFSVLNTNGKTITLLASASGSVQAELKNSLQITGASTNVALATATPETAQTSFKLIIDLDLVQSGGNFSLQNFNGATGMSTLIMGRHIRETAGTFVTRSTSSTAKFVVEMDYNYGGNFMNDIDQTIRLSSGTIDNAQHTVTLKLNSKTAYTGVTLQSPMTVGKVEFIGGPITTTATNILTITSTDAASAVVVGVKNSYVNGPVRIMTASTDRYVLPTGKSSMKMAQAYIYPSTAANSVYQAEYFRGGYSDVTNISKPLSGVATDKYWNIEKLSGTDASVQLNWKGAIEGAGMNDGIVVAHYNNGKWVTEQGEFQLIGTRDSGTIKSRQLDSYSAFTLGYASIASGTLPVKIVSFEAAKTRTGAIIEWKAEEIPARFDLQRSVDGKNFSTITAITGVSTKSLYSYNDLSLPGGTVYYRLHSIEKDGTGSYSKIAAIVNKDNGVTVTAMAPTFVNTQAKLMISAAASAKLELVVTDMLGRNMKQLQISVPAGASETVLDLSSLRSGIYQVGAVVNGVPVSVIRFQKN